MAKKQQEQKGQGRLDTFFDNLGMKSASTIGGYRTNIIKYLRFVFPSEKITYDNYADYVDRYFNDSPDVCEDFRQYLKQVIGNRPALSAKQSYNTLKVFFEVITDQPFSPKQIKALKNQLPSGSEAASTETDFTQENIRAILQHCDIKMKAIILCLATGGMRISDLLEMWVEDVKFDTVPVQVIVGNRKTHAKPRTAFITSEAAQALKAWLQVRDQYLKNTGTKALNFKQGSIKDTNTNLLFPMTQNTVNVDFRQAVLDAYGKNETDRLTGRSLLHIHGFRKFCSSQLGSVIMQGIVDKIIGHKTALSSAYDRYSVQQLSEQYLKAEHLLYIEAPAQLIETATKNTGKIEQIREQQDTAQALINRLQLDKMEQADQIKAQSEKIESLQESMSAVLKALERLNTIDQGTKDRINKFAPPAEIVGTE